MAKIKRFLLAVWSMSTTEENKNGRNFFSFASIWLIFFLNTRRIGRFPGLKTASRGNTGARGKFLASEIGV